MVRKQSSLVEILYRTQGLISCWFVPSSELWPNEGVELSQGAEIIYICAQLQTGQRGEAPAAASYHTTRHRLVSKRRGNLAKLLWNRKLYIYFSIFYCKPDKIGSKEMRRFREQQLQKNIFLFGAFSVFSVPFISASSLQLQVNIPLKLCSALCI